MGYSLHNSPDMKMPIVNEPDLLTTDDMYKTEVEILHGIAETESCVVAGRTGFYIYRDHPNHMSILIKASMQHRKQRLATKRGISLDEAESIIKKVDQMRENYISKYTGTSRYDSRYYDLVINMDGKNEEQVVDLILQYIG
jgi:cytidylate kinase